MLFSLSRSRISKGIVATMASKSKLRRFLVWGGLVLGLIILGRLLLQMSASTNLRLEDFVEYWSAGRLNLQRQNPVGCLAGLRPAPGTEHIGRCGTFDV